MFMADRLVVFVVLALFFGLTASGQAQIARNEEAIAEVRAGERTEANAAWWGFDPEDATEILQAAINSGAPKLIVPDMGQEWVVRPLTLRSNLEIILEEGVVIAAKRGEYHGSSDSVFSATGVDNLIIRGYGATIRMHKQDYMSPEYKKAEWRMGFRLLGCSNVEIHGVTIRDTGGDAIYLGRPSGGSPNENIVIRDIVADNNYRQGISVISARNLLIEHSVFKNTSGTGPSAGIDLEPNRSDEKLENIIIRNNVFENNVLGMHVYLNHMTSAAEISVLWENNIVRGGDYGIHVRRVHRDGPRGQMTFRGCIVEDSRVNGIRIRSVDADALHLVFEDCLLANVATKATHSEFGRSVPSPIAIISEITDPTDKKLASRVGGVAFRNVVVFDARERPAVAGIPQDKDALKSFADITGEIQVHSPYGAWAEWDGQLENVDLQLRAIPEPISLYGELLEQFEKAKIDARKAPYSWPAVKFDGAIARSGVQGMIDAGISLARGDAESIESVEILLDGVPIYAAPRMPEAGQVIVDTRTLTDGGHTLTATVALRDEHVEGVSQSITFTTRNFWELRDDFTAPKEMGGWFGAIDLSQTIEESAGWQYSTGREDEFLGDDSRKVRQANTTEYLVWETPLLGEFSLALYAKETAIDDIVELAVSPDGQSWKPVNHTRSDAGQSGQGWHKLMLAGDASGHDDIGFFKVTLRASAVPVEICLGEAHFRGMRPQAP
jgi:hypothetical protein